MDVVFTRLTPDTHRLRVERDDGPVQTLMRSEADVEAYRSMLEHVAPSLARDRPELAERLHEEFVGCAGTWPSRRSGPRCASPSRS